LRPNRAWPLANELEERCKSCRRPGKLRYVEFVAPNLDRGFGYFGWRRYPLDYEAVVWGEHCRSCIANSFASATTRTLLFGCLFADFLEMPFQAGKNVCWLVGKPDWVRPYTYTCLALFGVLIAWALWMGFHRH
jgi:hypothetical protein